MNSYNILHNIIFKLLNYTADVLIQLLNDVTQWKNIYEANFENYRYPCDLLNAINVNN